MNKDLFFVSLTATEPPSCEAPLQALWWGKKGDWERAHELAQEGSGPAGDWVHAWLHRQEGDLGNAAYWYRRAGQRIPSCSLDEEWEAIAHALLAAE